MNRRGLVVRAARYHWITYSFMVASVASHALSAKTTGTIYKAVYTFNTGQQEDNRSLHNLQQCFHKCSMTSKCNYVVLDKLNAFKMYNTRDEIPAEEELLGIWMQTSRQYVYRLFKEELDWNDARTMCQLHGGDLASITSKQEESKIKGLLLGYPGDKSFWLGLNDREVEGKYVWSDGSEYSYRNWREGEPNDKWGEDCTVTMSSLKWNDEGCERKYFFICKNPVYV